MTFERIPSPNHPLYADAMVLYGISFPAHEQRARNALADRHSDPP